jgi:hypothetical protein
MPAFALDNKGNKFYVGNCVVYKNRLFLVENIKDPLLWNREQYITLIDQKNKNKKVEFVLPGEVVKIRSQGNT